MVDTRDRLLDDTPWTTYDGAESAPREDNWTVYVD